MATKFYPKNIDRSAGDKVDSLEFNKDTTDLYEDLKLLFNRNMTAHAKNIITTSMNNTINAGMLTALSAGIPTQPLINVYSNFIYPDNLPKMHVDKMFNEITMNVDGEVNSLVNDDGSIKSNIQVQRLEDNFILSNAPESISELSINNSVNESVYPYLLRIENTVDPINISIYINALSGTIESNCIEIIPFPSIGGTSLQEINAERHEIGYMNLEDPNNEPVTINTDDRVKYRPNRFISKLALYDGISFNFRSNLITNTSIPSGVLGINNIKITNKTYSNESYIGFKINAQPGKSLKTIIPVLNSHNTYHGNYKIIAYNSEVDFTQKSENIIGEYDFEGIGPILSTDNDIWLLVEITTDINTSPQIQGFNYIIE